MKRARPASLERLGSGNDDANSTKETLHMSLQEIMSLCDDVDNEEVGKIFSAARTLQHGNHDAVRYPKQRLRGRGPGAQGPRVPGALGPRGQGSQGPKGPGSPGAQGPRGPGAFGPSNLYDKNIMYIANKKSSARFARSAATGFLLLIRLRSLRSLRRNVFRC